MACNNNVLYEKSSLLSFANDSKFCAMENGSGHSAALASYTSKLACSDQGQLSANGKRELVHIPLYGATDPLSFAFFFQILEFKILST